MCSSDKKVFFADHVFHVNKNVYEPAEDSFLFAENLAVKEGDKVLDLGAGCGILGIIAAAKAARVVAVDISPWAIRCAKENARLNHVAHKIFFVQGDMFAPIGIREKFDLILFNAPYVPSEDVEGGSWVERAWAGGVSGRKTIDNFIREAPEYLGCNGEIQLLQSTLSGVEETSRGFEERGLRMDFVSRQDLPFFETIVLLKAEFMNKKQCWDVGEAT